MTPNTVNLDPIEINGLFSVVSVASLSSLSCREFVCLQPSSDRTSRRHDGRHENYPGSIHLQFSKKIHSTGSHGYLLRLFHVKFELKSRLTHEAGHHLFLDIGLFRKGHRN